MPKQLNVNLAFTADTSQARQQLQQLQKQLTDLTNTSLGKKSDLGLVKDIQNATAAAAQLKVQLEGATNPKTGKLDLGKFNDSLKQSGQTLSDYKTQLDKLGPDGSKAFLSLAQSISNAEMPLRRTNALLAEMGTTIKNAARWQVSSSIIHGFMGAIQGAYGYAQDLNRSLTDIAIVTGNSVDNMAAFADQANKSAQALSTSTLAYTDAALIYYQQGLDDEAVRERTETTLKLSNVTRQSAEEVSSYMTAIWNNFYDGSQTLESFADKITALGAATASSSEEIAKGLNQFAALGSSLGLNYDDATAALATVVAQTRQSASTVGNSFRTLFQRIESLKLGDTLEDGVDLTKYSAALEKVGVQILDVNGEMRDMHDVIEDLGATWQNLSKAQQNALAQTVGGVRNSNTLIAWMDNFDKFQENLNIARNADGALQEQADIYAQSWEAAQKRVKAAWQAIYQDLINDDFFIFILNGVEKVLHGVDSLIDSIGGLKGVLTTIGFAISTLFEQQIAKSLENAAYNIKMMTSAGQQELKNKKAEAWDLASQINIDKGSNEGEAMTTNLQNTAILQKTLYENAHRMSDEELRINQILIDGNKALQDRNVEAAKAVDLAEEESIARRKSLLQASMKDAADDGRTFNQTDFSIGVSQINNEIQSYFNSIQLMKQAGASLEDIDKANASYINNIEQIASAYDISTQALWQYVAAKEAEAEKNSALIKAQDALSSSETNLLEKFKAGGVILQSYSTDIVRIAQSITGVLQILTNLNSIAETITAPDLTPWQRFTKVLGMVAITIPIISRVFSENNIAAWKNVAALVANTVASKGLTTAKAAQAFAQAGATAATKLGTAATERQVIANTALSASFGVLLPWLLGIAAAIGAVVVIAKIFDSAIYSSSERLSDANNVLKESQEALGQASDAAKGASDAYNNLAKTLDGWEDKRAGIDKLTSGTLEFKQAVTEANSELIQTLDNVGMLGKVQLNYDKNGVAYLRADDIATVMQAGLSKAMTAATAQTIARIQVEEDKYRVVVAESLQQIKDSAKVEYKISNTSDSRNTADAATILERIGGNFFTDKSDEAIVNTIETWAEKLAAAGYTSADLTADVIKNTDQLSFLEDIADDSDILSAIGNVVDAINTKDITSEVYKADLGQQAATNSGVNLDFLPDNMRQDFYAQLGDKLLGGNTFVEGAKTYQVSEDDRLAYAEEFDLKWDQIEQQWLDAQGRAIDDVSESYVQQWAYAKSLMSEANAELINSVAEDFRNKVQQNMFSKVGMNEDDSFARGWGQSQPGVQEYEDMINSANDAQLKIYASVEYEGESPLEFIEKLKAAEAEEHHIAIHIDTDDLTHFKGKEEDLAEEINDLTNFIQEHAASLDELDDHLADCREGAERVATAIIRFDDAIQDVTDNYEKWTDALNGDDYQSKVEALKDLRTAYGNLMDIDPEMLSALSENFLKDTTNLDLMKDAINNVDGAYDELMQKMGQQILVDIGIDPNHWEYDKNWIENSVRDLTGQDWGDIEVGADLNDADFLQGLTDMVNAAGMTADQATAYLASMGVDAKVVENDNEATETSKYVGATAHVESKTVEGTDPLTGEDKSYTIPSIHYEEDPMVTTSSKENKSFSLKVTAAEKSSGGGFKFEKANHGGGAGGKAAKGGGGGKKGGGGGGKAKKLKTEKPKDHKENIKEKDRYHNIKEEIEDLNTEMDRLNKNKDRAYGKSRIKYMDQEINKTKEQIKLTQKYIDEIKKYAKEDKAALEQTLKTLGMSDKDIAAQFDQDGVLKDYEGLLDAIQTKFDQTVTSAYNNAIDEYNRAVATFNASDQGDAATEAFDKAKEALSTAEETYKKQEETYKKQLDSLKQYEETINLLQEKEQELIDQMNDLYDKQLELVKEKVDINVSLNEDDLKLLEWQLGHLGESLDHAADRIANLGKQMDANARNMAHYQAGIEGIFANHNVNIDLSQYKDGASLLAALEKGKNDLTGVLTDEEVQTIRDYRDALMEAYDNMRELTDQVTENVTNAYDEWNDKLDEQIEKFDKYKDFIATWKEIAELTGKNALGLSDQDVLKFQQQMVDTAQDAVQAAKDIADAHAAEVERLKQILANSDLTEYERAEYEKMLKVEEEYAEAAKEQALEKFKEALQEAEELFNQTLEANANTYKKMMSGGLGSLDLLQEQFNRQKKLNHLYLDNYEKYKKLGDLTAQINKNLTDVSSIKIQEKLNTLLDDINSKMGENYQISEGEAEILARRLALLQAEMQLEDARNAKSAVRMTRDNEGNFSYTYTADQDAISEAQQNYADKFYDLLDYERNLQEDMQDQMLQTMAEFVDKRNEIWNDTLLTDEERKAALEKLYSDYDVLMQFFADQFGMTMDEMKRLRDDDWMDFEDILNRKLASQDDFIVAFEDTLLGTVVPGWESIIDVMDSWGQSSAELYRKDNEAFAHWQEENASTWELAGYNVDKGADEIQKALNGIEKESNAAAEATKKMAQEMNNAMDGIISKAGIFYDSWADYMEKSVKKVNTMSTALNELLRLLGEVDDKSTGSNNNNNSSSSSSSAGNGSGGGGPTSKGGSGTSGKLTIGTVATYTGGAYYSTSYGGGNTGNRGPGKKVRVTYMNPGAPYPIHVESSDSAYGWLREDQLTGYDTGGFTGKWGKDGKLAVLHEKELVLNKDDTGNLLNVVDMVRKITTSLNLQNSSLNLTGSRISEILNAGFNKEPLEQNVHISASFPNVQSHNEIELAMSNLINSATQYVNRK